MMTIGPTASDRSGALPSNGFDVALCAEHTMFMDYVSPAHLKDIGLDAAREVVGEGRAQEIEVTVDLDSTNEPAYFFSFLIEQDRDPMRAALQRTRLGQRIRDKLIDRGDDRYPYIRVLGRKDWGKRLGD